MSFRDFFRRAPKPILPDSWKDSPDTWFPGDIAVCVAPSPWYSLNGRTADGPEVNQSLPVISVVLFEGRQFLVFERWPANFYSAACFVKAKPDEAKGSRRAWRDLFQKHRGKVDA